jgi:hypothetical protein
MLGSAGWTTDGIDGLFFPSLSTSSDWKDIEGAMVGHRREVRERFEDKKLLAKLMGIVCRAELLAERDGECIWWISFGCCP